MKKPGRAQIKTVGKPSTTFLSMSSTRNSEPAKNANQNSSNMSGYEAQLLVNVCVLVVPFRPKACVINSAPQDGVSVVKEERWLAVLFHDLSGEGICDVLDNGAGPGLGVVNYSKACTRV